MYPVLTATYSSSLKYGKLRQPRSFAHTASYFIFFLLKNVDTSLHGCFFRPHFCPLRLYTFCRCCLIRCGPLTRSFLCCQLGAAAVNMLQSNVCKKKKKGQWTSSCLGPQNGLDCCGGYLRLDQSEQRCARTSLSTNFKTALSFVRYELRIIPRRWQIREAKAAEEAAAKEKAPGQKGATLLSFFSKAPVCSSKGTTRTTSCAWMTWGAVRGIGTWGVGTALLCRRRPRGAAWT